MSARQRGVIIPQHLLDAEKVLREETCKNGKVRCGAPNVKRDKNCLQWVGRGLRCKMHGGSALKGVANPNFKHGLRSRYMPARLSEAYERSINDPELESLRHQLAMCDAREQELQHGLTTGDCGDVWRDLQAAWARRSLALEQGDPVKLMDAETEVAGLIERGASDAGIWGEMLRLFEARRKLADTETRRLERLNASITAEKMFVLVARLVHIIRSHIPDPHTLSAVQGEIAAAMGNPAGLLPAGVK